MCKCLVLSEMPSLVLVKMEFVCFEDLLLYFLQLGFNIPAALHGDDAIFLKAQNRSFMKVSKGANSMLLDQRKLGLALQDNCTDPRMLLKSGNDEHSGSIPITKQGGGYHDPRLCWLHKRCSL